MFAAMRRVFVIALVLFTCAPDMLGGSTTLVVAQRASSRRGGGGGAAASSRGSTSSASSSSASSRGASATRGASQRQGGSSGRRLGHGSGPPDRPTQSTKTARGRPRSVPSATTQRSASAQRSGPRTVQTATQRPATARRSVTPTSRGGPRTAQSLPASRPNTGSAVGRQRQTQTVPASRGAPRTVPQDGATSARSGQDPTSAPRDNSQRATDTPTTLPNERESTTRDPTTIVNRALSDTNARLDGLQQSVDDAIRDRNVINDYGVDNVFGVGLGLGYGARYYDGGYGGFGGYNDGLGLGLGMNAWSTFPDPCCMSGIASASAYCGLGGIGGFGIGMQTPCCVGGGSYMCTAAVIEQQAVVDRQYPEPCCSSGVAIRGQFCGSRFDETGSNSFPCCANGEYVCAPDSTSEVKNARVTEMMPQDGSQFSATSTSKDAPLNEAIRPQGLEEEVSGQGSENSEESLPPSASPRLRVNLTSMLMDGTWIARDADWDGEGDESEACVLDVKMDETTGQINAVPTTLEFANGTKETEEEGLDPDDVDTGDNLEDSLLKNDTADVRCLVSFVTGKRVGPKSTAIALAFENLETGEVTVRTGYVRLVTNIVSAKNENEKDVNENGVSLAVTWEDSSEDSSEDFENEHGAYAGVWVKV